MDNEPIVQKTNVEKAGILVAECNGNGSEIINVVAGLLGALDSEREKNDSVDDDGWIICPNCGRIKCE